jgi:hypothetical protein
VSIGPENLNPSVRMLRQLNRGDLADQLIDEYVATRLKKAEQIFDPERRFSVRELDDEALRTRLADEYAKAKKLPSLRDSLLKIGREKGWGTTKP